MLTTTNLSNFVNFSASYRNMNMNCLKIEWDINPNNIKFVEPLPDVEVNILIIIIIGSKCFSFINIFI